jgi:hypothetical protein
VKNLLAAVMFIFYFCNCQKQETEFLDGTPKQIFNSLPETKTYSNGPYQLLIDVINSDSLAYYHVSGKLFFQTILIWQRDTSYSINATGDNGLVLIQNTIALIGTFDSSLFYKGEDITAKATPKGFPSICEIRCDNNLIYLSYGDYGTFRRHEENLYASYNLITGELKL